MLTLPPSTSSSSIQWSTNLELEQYFENFDPCAYLFSNDAQIDQQQGSPSDPSEHVVVVGRKLNHNANERHRRRKISTMYTSLRSLLPGVDHKRSKLSMPATISHVLEYIPKLRQELEELSEKKEDLLRRVCRSRENQKKPHKPYSSRSRRNIPFVISLSQLNEQELVIQISTEKLRGDFLAEMLVMLETEGAGILLQNASSFEEYLGEKVLHTLHFQVGRNYDEQQLEALKEKLQSYLG